jgi:hypothetical protein
MKTELKDVLHFYLGCDVMHKDGTTATMISVDRFNAGFIHHETQMYGEQSKDSLEITPILRSFSSITEEEKEAYETYYMSLEYEREEDNHAICDAEISAQTTRWLISRGFDMFNLIENGLAIEATQS